jgi:hypothetical protein
MPEHVVYLLGAGFSAPLGLPVMANFVSKSKDQYVEAAAKYKHFEDVFALFNKLATVKSFYHSDLSNIEEILSILSIGDIRAESVDRTRFVRYLADVIQYYTPDVIEHPRLPGNWRQFVFGENRSHNDYGNFVFGLARRSLDGGAGRYSTSPPSGSVPTYAVVSLNYDCVIENVHDYCNRNLALAVPLNRSKPCKLGSEEYHIYLAKLHGSVHDQSIVPPTWSKGPDRLPTSAWQGALHEIGRANHLRIFGYSLPDSDLNVRYLLKAAALESFHLKTIDVVCLDTDDSVKRRYDSFIDHPGYRFKNASVGDYFSNITARADGTPAGNVALFLEQTHAHFMGR